MIGRQQKGDTADLCVLSCCCVSAATRRTVVTRQCIDGGINRTMALVEQPRRHPGFHTRSNNLSCVRQSLFLPSCVFPCHQRTSRPFLYAHGTSTDTKNGVSHPLGLSASSAHPCQLSTSCSRIGISSSSTSSSSSGRIQTLQLCCRQAVLPVPGQGPAVEGGLQDGKCVSM